MTGSARACKVAIYNKGSQVQILSARRKGAGDLRKRRSPFSLGQGCPPKTHRFQARGRCVATLYRSKTGFGVDLRFCALPVAAQGAS
jgi:hypothetical protein